jgi:integrase
MPRKGSGYQNLVNAEEGAVIQGWIDSRKNTGTTLRTQNKQRHIAYLICHLLHENTEARLDTAQGEDFAKVAQVVGQTVTQNSRQTILSQLKSMVRHIQKKRIVKNADAILIDVKAGSPSKQNKNVLTPREWERVLNLPMSAKDRAYLAMLYDGYHRPYEPYLLKWSDLKIGTGGNIEYQVTFKTGISRTIVQKGDTTAILELWRRECGHNYGDDAYVFPDNNGRQYKTLMQSVRLFRRLQTQTGYKTLLPSSIRNTAISHEVQAGLPLSYICMRAWGEPYNDMINIYVKTNSAQMQIDQQAKNGQQSHVDVGDTAEPRKISNLMECPHCHKRNFSGGAFCSFCGKSMSGDGIEQIAQEREAIRLMGSEFVRKDDLARIVQEAVAAALPNKQ